MESGRLLRRETEVSNRRNCHLFLVPPATHRKDCSGGGGGRGGASRARGGRGSGSEEWVGGVCGGGSGGRRGKFEDRRDAAGPFVIDSGQYGCAQVSLLLFVGRVTQAVAPASAHSCKVKTVGPSTLAHPSVHASVSPLSLSLSLSYSRLR